MRAKEFLSEKKKRKKTKLRKAAYGPGLYGGYGYFSNYGNSDGGDAGGDGGGESIHELFDVGKDSTCFISFCITLM